MKRLFCLCLILIIGLAGLPTFAAAESEEEPFIPTVLPRARFDELMRRVSESDDRGTRLMDQALSGAYTAATLADLLTSDVWEERCLGIHLLGLAAPEGAPDWAALTDPEFLITEEDLQPLMEDAALRELFSQEYMIADSQRRSARQNVLRLLYGDGRVRGIGYTAEEAASDAAWCVSEIPDEPCYKLRMDGTAVFARCSRASAECEILAEYKGRPVTAVGDEAFYACVYLERVTIPDSVTVIGKWAFYSCESLTDIVLPSGVTGIGEAAFACCASLKSVALPEGLTEIGNAAFICCPALEEITIPGSVREVGGFVFSHDVSRYVRYFSADPAVAVTIPPYLLGTSLTRVTLCEGVETIEARAFLGCEKLTTLVIPDSVTRIGERAFEGCPSLTVTVPSGSYAEQYCIENGLHYSISEP